MSFLCLAGPGLLGAGRLGMRFRVLTTIALPCVRFGFVPVLVSMLVAFLLILIGVIPVLAFSRRGRRRGTRAGWLLLCSLDFFLCLLDNLVREQPFSVGWRCSQPVEGILGDTCLDPWMKTKRRYEN